MASHDDDFAQKTLLAFATMSRLVWGINQVLIHELDLEAQSPPLMKALRDAQQNMVAAVRDLGVDVEPFEAYEIKAAARKTPTN